MSISEVYWDRFLNQTTSLQPATSQLGYSWNQAQVFRELQVGDFKTPTPYKTVTADRVGGLFALWEISYRRYIWKVGLWSDPEISYGYVNQVPGSVLALDPAELAFQKTLALEAITGKISDMVPTWDILTDVAEVSELVSLLRSFYKQTGQLVHGYRKRDANIILKALGFQPSFKRKAGRKRVHSLPRKGEIEWLIKNSPDPASFVSSAWLTWRYALMPCVYSTEDILATFSEPVESDVSDTLTSQVTIPFTVDGDSEDFYSDLPYGGRVTMHASNTIIGSYRIRASYSFKKAIWGRLGLTDITSVAITLYELKAFSFILDWFYDIGNALSMVRLNNLLVDCQLNCTLKTKASRNVTVQSVDLPKRASWMSPPNYFTDFQYKLLKSDLSGIRQQDFTFSREKGSLTPPMPNLEFGMDTLKRKLDAFALTYLAYKSAKTDLGWNKFRQIVGKI